MSESKQERNDWIRRNGFVLARGRLCWTEYGMGHWLPERLKDIIMAIGSRIICLLRGHEALVEEAAIVGDEENHCVYCCKPQKES